MRNNLCSYAYTRYDIDNLLTWVLTMLFKKLVSDMMAIFTVLLMAASCTVYADPVVIDQVVVFGDSLSDNGNTWNYTYYWNKIDPWNIPVVPKSPPYYNGRFSNGPVWVEVLAQSINATLIDWAYGGSWVEKISNFLPSLSMQVKEYYYRDSDKNMGQHLFVIWDGSNDYMHDPNTPPDAVDNTIADIKYNIEYLIGAGAKNFLLVGLPDFSKVPGIIAQGPDFAAAKGALAAEHNQKLFAMIDSERQLYPDVKFVAVDIKDYFNDMTSNPAKYNLQNVTDPCYSGGFTLRQQLLQSWQDQHHMSGPINMMDNPQLREAYLVGQLSDDVTKCDNEDAYLYWDKVHPTRAVHQIIATMALKILNDNDIFGSTTGSDT